MKPVLDHRKRYLQLAFNHDAEMVERILPGLAADTRILIEAGTPYIKREGMAGIATIRSYWRGHIVADLKTVDGAAGEVAMVAAAGATAATVLGSAPPEVLNLFVRQCKAHGLLSMVDMLGVSDPLDTLRHMRVAPDVVVLHRGRDEEKTRGKVIQYRHVKRIRSKFDVIISAAGGVNLKEARSAIFNGANMVVANIVKPDESFTGISSRGDVAAIAKQFLDTIA